MATKTINFEKWVLNRLEKKADEEGTTVSKIVNHIVRDIILNDASYYQYKAKEHYLKFQEFNFLKDQAKNLVDCKNES